MSRKLTDEFLRQSYMRVKQHETESIKAWTTFVAVSFILGFIAAIGLVIGVAVVCY